jgi:hypothetical protein
MVVDDTEYRALCELRDGLHEALKLRLMRLEEHYQALLEVNRDQLSRLTGQGMELLALRARLVNVTKQTESWLPVETEQPLFKRSKK